MTEIDFNRLGKIKLSGNKWTPASENMNLDQHTLNPENFTDQEKQNLGQRILEHFNDAHISGANRLKMSAVFDHIVNSIEQLH
jgi:molybdenum cofactor biosynthesis enzyme MoaA